MPTTTDDRVDIDERVGMLRELLGFYGETLGWPHVTESSTRRAAIIGSMTWASMEIARINTQEARLMAWVHPDTLQREVFVALKRKEYQDRVEANRTSVAAATVGGGKTDAHE